MVIKGDKSGKNRHVPKSPGHPRSFTTTTNTNNAGQYFLEDVPLRQSVPIIYVGLSKMGP
ncbi:hypothetical protein DERP_002835 [Dermatophagoides pteronyssinus]|uniref:Uncharacterized protein n=1 Tax=Dermatophagoides pteronyssinus TaxID=6956 RepID=A0ABQ8JW87_DERPT|nr:hypothetical protein DERP_002835 [Dermatophagoides pteronyssinus]